MQAEDGIRDLVRSRGLGDVYKRQVDPLQFLRSVRDENGARTRLDDIIDSMTRDIISGTNLEEIVRSRDWSVDIKAIEDESMVREDVDLLGKPKKGRALLEKEILAAASERMPEMGIELVDVRLKRINYIESVGAQVESRMISERQSIAERFRSEGQGKSQEILGEMEKDCLLYTSDAADERSRVDLGGRRSIKKKNKGNHRRRRPMKKKKKKEKH